MRVARLRRLKAVLWVGCLWGCWAPARGEVIRFEITERKPFANGHSFGTVGPYERLRGRVHFAIDPAHPANAAIVDLKQAPRNGQGKVEFHADVDLLAPVDLAKGNGAILYDVNNRGNKLALKFFNDANGGNDVAESGNAFLFWRGYTVLWSGWNGELLPGDGRLQLSAPVAADQGKPISGKVRYEICPEREVTRLSVVRSAHGAYRPTAEGLRKATLSWRLYPRQRRIPIPRGQFQIHVQESGSDPSQLPLVEVELPAGFRPGYLYELIYEAQDPLVHGTCFASVRDLISSLRHGTGDRHPFTGNNAGRLTRAYGFGVSQSGRFLREFVYSGFNADEHGRRVFDGLMPHVAGGGLGSFNYRFAQPTIYSSQHEQHDWPIDRFPFAYETQEDPFTKVKDGILARAAAQNCVPKIMHTQSATEYWTRAGSLVHTDPLGREDAKIPETVRIYAFGGTQHGPASFPPEAGPGQTLANPADYRPLLRALLDRLDQWCRDDRAPPPSVYPRISDSTLAGSSRQATGFPLIPGTRFPEVIATPSLLHLGDRWEKDKIIDVQPPVRRSDYLVLVPRCDQDGNERGCLLPPEVAVPIATFTGWSLRSRTAGAENDLVGLNGSYILFAANATEREAKGDPRKSVAERYASLDDYVGKIEQECQRLEKAGYLLSEDMAGIVARQRLRAAPLFGQP